MTDGSIIPKDCKARGHLGKRSNVSMDHQISISMMRRSCKCWKVSMSIHLHYSSIEDWKRHRDGVSIESIKEAFDSFFPCFATSLPNTYPLHISMMVNSSNSISSAQFPNKKSLRLVLDEPVLFVHDKPAMIRGEVIVHFLHDTPIQGPIELVFEAIQTFYPWSGTSNRDLKCGVK